MQFSLFFPFVRSPYVALVILHLAYMPVKVLKTLTYSVFFKLFLSKWSHSALPQLIIERSFNGN